MKLVLLERVDNLGVMGDVVNVRPGFARNFLLPQEKALRATDANMIRFEAEREALEKRNAERAAVAGESGEAINGEIFVMIRQAGESGQLYGSVTSRDVSELISEGGTTVSRSQVSLDNPIKTLGLHDVRIRLHAEVSVTVTVNVARSEEEAERQEEGTDIVAEQAEEDRAIDEALAADLFDASEEGQEAADRAVTDTESAEEEEAPAED